MPVRAARAHHPLPHLVHSSVVDVKATVGLLLMSTSTANPTVDVNINSNPTLAYPWVAVRNCVFNRSAAGDGSPAGLLVVRSARGDRVIQVDRSTVVVMDRAFALFHAKRWLKRIDSQLFSWHLEGMLKDTVRLT